MPPDIAATWKTLNDSKRLFLIAGPCVIESEEHTLAINGTQLLIGEIRLLEFPDHAQREDGALRPDIAGTVALSGLDSYHRAAPPRRMAYAKPELPPREL